MHTISLQHSTEVKSLFFKLLSVLDSLKSSEQFSKEVFQDFPTYFSVQHSLCLGMNYYVNFLEGLGSNEFDKKSRFGTMVGLLLKVSRE